MNEPQLRNYLKGIERAYQQGNATEHTYRADLKELLEALAPDITATNEPKRVQCGAPDFSIARITGVMSLPIGYVEAKDININLDAIERDSKLSDPKTREGKQLKSYLRALDNLVFTDYLE